MSERNSRNKQTCKADKHTSEVTGLSVVCAWLGGCAESLSFTSGIEQYVSRVQKVRHEMYVTLPGEYLGRDLTRRKMEVQENRNVLLGREASKSGGECAFPEELSRNQHHQNFKGLWKSF